jgi:hypothetical protein
MNGGGGEGIRELAKALTAVTGLQSLSIWCAAEPAHARSVAVLVYLDPARVHRPHPSPLAVACVLPTSAVLLSPNTLLSLALADSSHSKMHNKESMCSFTRARACTPTPAYAHTHIIPISITPSLVVPLNLTHKLPVSISGATTHAMMTCSPRPSSTASSSAPSWSDWNYCI